LATTSELEQMLIFTKGYFAGPLTTSS